MEDNFDMVADLDALAWQIELGADEAISESPINRFELGSAPPKPIVSQEKAAPAKVEVPTAPLPDEVASMIAANCADLAQLELAIRAFDGCALKKGAKNTVFSDGTAQARVMIVGEAPGRDEDIEGKPFVGRSGHLLDRMLAAIGLSRHAEASDDAVYITNVMPWRPPQNRDPSTDEIAMMRAFLLRHIELAEPEFLVTMGNPATKTVLNTTTGITRMRGTWADFNGIPVLPMFHPAALLRDPLKKKDAWSDLLSLKARLA